jgi:ubiquitin C-terminal hydrolase
MIYDCYAVSNHYGNMGFGHYTAYGKNPLNQQWYEFDDSRLQQIKENPKEHVCTGAAYNLFYRRRDWHEKNIKEGCNFEDIAIKPDMDMLNKK